MWRLKVGEGGNNPYIFSTNKFLGRQTGEFDPNAGTAEERGEVEEARTNFYNNCNNVQPSSDLLWQLQGCLYPLVKRTEIPPNAEKPLTVNYRDIELPSVRVL
ncbi:hypothetical protein F3Y22_tig00003041pilonHSYRG00136 [Hibiscus syriacus]|uniref:Uncharacterized protein n=1 Tax=Hibiscus syriacus TaxID=106335 RepID=A0A6A3CM50_HIBSY|nr:hypothetical protein F3Y22_tig00003041pilonHSYRG00136 [Hibiscus syriacus]